MLSVSARHEARADLIVFSARKAWDLFHILRPFLMRHYSKQGINFDDIEARVSSSSVMSVWPNAHDYDPSTIRVVVVDDSCVRGHSIGDIVRDLHYAYKIGNQYSTTPEGNIVNDNILIYAFEVASDLPANKEHIVEREGKVKALIFQQDDIRNRLKAKLEIPWACTKVNYVPKNNIKYTSKQLIEAMAVTSTPYIGFICAFVLSLKDAEGIFGRLTKYKSSNLQQSDLKGDFKDPNKYEFYKASSVPYYENAVETFVLFPTNDTRKHFKFLSTNKDIGFALRIYVNRNLDEVMILPFVDLGTLEETIDIIAAFPGKLQNLFNTPECKANIERAKPLDKVAACRVLSYALGYAWGKSWLKTATKKYSFFHNINCQVTSLLGMHYMDTPDPVLEAMGLPRRVVLLNNWLNRDNIVSELCELLERLPPDTTEADSFFDKSSDTNVKALFDSFYNDTIKDKELDVFGINAGLLFRELWEYGTNNPNVKMTIPLRYFVEKLGLDYGISKNKCYAIAFYLFDSGQANITFKYAAHNGLIDNCITYGEQSCHAIYYAMPSYAYFLQRIIDAKRFELIDELKAEITYWFGKLKTNSRTTDNYLVHLKKIGKLAYVTPDHLPVASRTYCAEPKLKRMDVLYYFFSRIMRENDLLP